MPTSNPHEKPVTLKTRDSDREFVFSPTERFRLDEDSPLPLYHQVQQIVLDRISRADMANRWLPSEGALAEIFGVSRITIKRAIADLVMQGLVERKRALGTRVIKQPEITEDLARLSSYTEEMASRRLETRTSILYVGHHVPEPHVRKHLGLNPRQKTLCVKRLRGTTEIFPVVILQTEVPEAFGISSDEDFTGSFYRIVEERCGIPIVYAVETIGAAQASEAEAELLEIQQGDSVLVMERITYTTNDRPLEYVKGVYRPDRYKFSIRLRR